MHLVICDPELNVVCSKTYCHINGGECYLSKDSVYELKGKPTERQLQELKAAQDAMIINAEQIKAQVIAKYKQQILQEH